MSFWLFKKEISLLGLSVNYFESIHLGNINQNTECQRHKKSKSEELIGKLGIAIQERLGNLDF